MVWLFCYTLEPTSSDVYFMSPRIFETIHVGCMYEVGDGAKQDATRAFHFFRAAAQQGDPKGLFNAGRMLLIGEAVPEDRSAARFYFVEAAFRGHHGAQELLPKRRHKTLT